MPDDRALRLISERLFGELLLALPAFATTPVLLWAERWIRFHVGRNLAPVLRILDGCEDRVRACLTVVQSRMSSGGPYLAVATDLFWELLYAARAYCRLMLPFSTGEDRDALLGFLADRFDPFDALPFVEEWPDNRALREEHLSLLSWRPTAEGLLRFPVDFERALVPFAARPVSAVFPAAFRC